MIEQELRNEIGKKFSSILDKLAKFAVEDVTKNASPQLRYLVSGCMEAMERSHIEFCINEKKRTRYNQIFEQIGSKCRISLPPPNGLCTYTLYKTDIEYLSRLYNVFNQIDNFLSELEKTKTFFTIINETEQLFNSIGVNQNYKDEVKYE